jgi:hypothetical protein
VGIFGSVFLVDPFITSFDPQCRSECIWRQLKIYALKRRRRRRRRKRKKTKRRTRNGIISIKRGGRGK